MPESDPFLQEIYNIEEKGLKFYLSAKGSTYFSLNDAEPLPTSQMPRKLKTAFLSTFIQRPYFAEKLRPLNDIDRGIDMHIKGCHYGNLPLEIEAYL